VYGRFAAPFTASNRLFARHPAQESCSSSHHLVTRKEKLRLLVDGLPDELLRLATDLYGTPEPHPPPLRVFVGIRASIDLTLPRADEKLEGFGR
jgi:hypothetical protein